MTMSENIFLIRLQFHLGVEKNLKKTNCLRKTKRYPMEKKEKRQRKKDNGAAVESATYLMENPIKDLANKNTVRLALTPLS